MAGIPVLMFHSIDSSVQQGKALLRNVSVALSFFEESMAWLHGQGYHTITDAEEQQYITKGVLPAGKPVKITFDDGYLSTYAHALPALAKYGFTATLFLSTAYVGKAYYDLSDFAFVKADRPLTWPEVAMLADNGWSVQSHGDEHVRMSGLKKEELLRTLTLSKQGIERHTGREVHAIAYPYGSYSSEVLSCAAVAGYTMGYTVHPGLSFPFTPGLRVPRVELNNMDDIASFKRKVLTGYVSSSQAFRSGIRNFAFAQPGVKDAIENVMRLVGKG